ncbi:MAG: PT domain-containing protein [Anaerolineaceae bacterium]|nr:PT domain-containing protein [Anaerolineaceae bacterium]
MKKVFHLFLMFSLAVIMLSVNYTAFAQEPEPTDEASAAQATDEPAAEPTAEPTDEPTAEPTAEPTQEPTAEPTDEPTAEPTDEPTAEPTDEPTAEPTDEPTAEPTDEPTAEPTDEPTAEPTVEVTVEPTVEATVEPTVEPTVEVAGEIDEAASSNSPYTSEIFLQNTSSGDAQYSITYYDSTTSYVGASGTLNGHGGRSVDVAGETNVPANFKGSGVVQAESQLAATVVQYSSTDVMVSNGLTAAQGGSTLFAPSVQCNYTSLLQTAELAVQNVTDGDIQVTITLNKAGSSPVTSGPHTVNANESYFVNVPGLLGAACNNWLGSATVTTANGSQIIVGVVNTTYGNANSAFSSEMVASGGSVLYFPTFQYNYAAPLNFNTNVAVQNTSPSSSIIVCAEYYQNNAKTGQTVQKSLGPLGKDSVRSTDFGLGGGNLGAAIFRAYSGGTCSAPGSAANTFVAVMNQFSLSDSNRVTSYGGFVGGSNAIAFPFGNWLPASSALDTYFAVQNVSGGNVDITATFYETNSSGAVISTKTLPVFASVANGAKINPRISDLAGVGANGSWTGVVEVTATGPIVGLGTVQPGSLKQLASYSSVPFTQ